MKVLHISTSDRQGGAAIAAYRLNEALQNEGVDSKMLVYNKITLNPTVERFSSFCSIWEKLFYKPVFPNCYIHVQAGQFPVSGEWKYNC